MPQADQIHTTPPPLADVTRVTPIPSPFDLARLLAAWVDDRAAVIEEMPGSAPALDLFHAINLLDDRTEAIHDLMATLPAITLEDAMAQLSAAFSVAGKLVDMSLRKRERRLLARQLRTCLVSAIPTIADRVGFDLDAIAAGDLPSLKRALFRANLTPAEGDQP